jgi:hypothetical protein
MLYLPDMKVKGASDSYLDTISPGNRGMQVTRLGEGNQAIFDEWKQLYQRFPGFVGLVLKTANNAQTSTIQNIPFMVYKNFYEGSVAQGLMAIEDYWRDPYASVEDCWVTATGAHFYNKNGGIDAPVNMFNMALHKYVMANRLLNA